MKKTSTLNTHCTLLLCTIIFFSLNSCSKEDEVIKTEPISLSAEKNQYASYEIVTISASEDLFTEKSFTAVINNIEITIGGEGNIAAFVLPDLNNGKYDLSFTLNQKNYMVPITIASLSNIQSADQYFTEIQTSLNQNINDLNTQITQLSQSSENQNEFIKLQNDVIKYTNLLNDYTASYNNLSELDKIEFAKSIEANKASIDEYDNLATTFYSSTLSLRGGQSIQDYEANVEASSLVFYSCVNEMAQQIPLIVAGAIISKTPIHPFINAGAILATGLLVTRFMITVDKTITAAMNLTNKSIKPFEFVAQTSQTVYNSNVETVSNIEAKYRSVINSDGSDGSTINTIVEKYNYFKDKYNGFISELPSIFRPSYIMTSLKNTSSNTTRAVYNNYLSITNISNPNVTLQQLNQPDGSIKIKATTTSTTDQTFTYNVNYTNNNFTNGLTKTVNAKVTASSDLDTLTLLRSKIWVLTNANIESIDGFSCGVGNPVHRSILQNATLTFGGTNNLLTYSSALSGIIKTYNPSTCVTETIGTIIHSGNVFVLNLPELYFNSDNLFPNMRPLWNSTIVSLSENQLILNSEWYSAPLNFVGQ
jgi:hypothetical protein